MLPKFEYLFVTTQEGAAALDLLEGPQHVIHLKNGRMLPAPVSEKAIPYTYEPSFFDLVVSVVAPEHKELEISRQRDNVVLYRFPAAVAGSLAQLTPDRPDLTRATIAEITRQLMRNDQVRRHFKESGVSSAVLSLRGYALKTSNERDMYYWFCRRLNE